jgi:hypothetical protein
LHFERIFYDKALLPGGLIVEMVIWKLPKPTLNQIQEIRLAADYLGDRVGIDKAQYAVNLASAFVEKLAK